MMTKMKTMILILMLTLIVTVGFGCSNADNLNLPELPNTGTDGTQGDEIDPDIPTPYTQLPDGYNILDFAFEKDGDLAISEASSGVLLFDTFGELKRNISNGQAGFNGLIDVGPGALDSGRGIIATGNSVIGGGWTSFYDDQYVTGGTLGPSAPDWWLGGVAHPGPECSIVATSGAFADTGDIPRGIDIHPITGWLFLKVQNPKVTLDGSDCDFDYDEIPPERDLGNGIIAMHPMAPQNGADPYHFEGTYDWIAYHDLTDVQLVNTYGYPMVDASVQVFCWDETNPFTMLPPRDGVETANVSDFRFDAYGRMILTLPNANAFAITDPVVPGEMIVTQRIIGGAVDGTSHNPGDFYGPTGVGIDPRNQEIYIADTGLNRVQVFDSQGTFIRMFGAGIGATGLGFTAPRAIEIDSFGNVYVSTQEGLQIFNEYGEPVAYGSIEGYVKDKATGVGLDNAVVSISSTYRQYATATDDNGYFKFKTVPQGDHTLIANRAGYQAQYTNVFVNGGYNTTSTIYLERTGVGSSGVGDVAGKFMSSLDGDAVSGLLVTIKGLGISDYSNANGEFHLYSVPEGDHVLQALSGSQVIYETDVKVNADSLVNLGYIYLPI